MINHLISILHYKPIQLFTRLKLLFFSRSKVDFYTKKINFHIQTKGILHFLINSLDDYHALETIDKLRDGKIPFLGHLSANIDSFFKNKFFFENDNLKKYELSYFHFITSLIHCEDKDFLESILDKIDIIYSEAKKLDASHPFWYPYAVSSRIINIFILTQISDSQNLSKNRIDNIYQYLYWDYKYLQNNIEFDSDGNHLLKNYIALSICSHIFDRKLLFDDYYGKLINALDYQIIDKSGMHYEKSLDYHNSILYDLYILYLVIGNEIKPQEKGADKDLKKFISKMFHFSSLFYKKEKILINDSFVNYHFSEECFLRYLQSYKDHKNLESLESGSTFKSYTHQNHHNPQSTFPFEILKTDNNIEMILYNSDINPIYCPAHLHDAISTYELWINGKKFITDSGNFDYNDSRKRMYYRSSHAHNISTSLDNSQSILIKPFRFGKTAKINSFNRTNKSINISFLEVRNLFKYNKIKREVVKENQSITVKDTTSKLNSKSYIHLHPTVKILYPPAVPHRKSNPYPFISTKKYILSKDGVKLTLVVNSPITKSSILKTNFSDKFYKESFKQTIILEFDNHLEYSYIIDSEDKESPLDDL